MVAGHSSGLRGFIRLFAPLAVAIVIVAALLAYALINAGGRRLALNGEMAAQVAAAALRTSLDSTLQHFRSLTSEAPIRGVIDAHTPKDLEPMAGAFRSLLQRNPSYAQARWVDESGLERVRLERDDGEIVRVADTALQDKHMRPYVREALSLPPGAIYVSPLDLNVEYGEIETPRRPMLRIAARMATGDGSPRGLIVINIEGQHYIDMLDRSDDVFAGDVWLLNSRGEWLRGPRPEDDFAFMEGRDATLRTSDPDLWRTMSSTPLGCVAGPSGVWAWTHLRPLPDTQAPATYDNQTPWLLVAHLPADAVAAVYSEVLRPTIGIAALLLGLFGLLVWRLAREREQLAAARLRAEAATRAKSSFLANMSHVGQMRGNTYSAANTRLSVF